MATASGAVVGLAGLSFLGAGLWARRTVAQALARERIVGTSDMSPPGAPITTAAAARSLSEVIRARTLSASDGKTYAEVDAYLDPDGRPTSDSEAAMRDPRSGEPVENPAHALWLQSTTLQTALMQAYLSFRVAELNIALGGALVAAGAGIVAAASRR